MGRIKSTMIKRTGEKLIQKDTFSADFNDNKRFIDKVMPSKKVRNKIAGYIARLVRRKNEQ